MTHKILIIDDSEVARLKLRNVLSQKNFEIVEAVSGAEGLQMLEKHKDVALILCDVNMPEMDGMTMCSILRTKEEYNDIPIIMVTTETSADMKQRGRELNILAWATKPINPEKIAQVIIRQIGQK